MSFVCIWGVSGQELKRQHGLSTDRIAKPIFFIFCNQMGEFAWYLVHKVFRTLPHECIVLPMSILAAGWLSIVALNAAKNTLVPRYSGTPWVLKIWLIPLHWSFFRVWRAYRCLGSVVNALHTSNDRRVSSSSMRCCCAAIVGSLAVTFYTKLDYQPTQWINYRQARLWPSFLSQRDIASKNTYIRRVVLRN